MGQTIALAVLIDMANELSNLATFGLDALALVKSTEYATEQLRGMADLLDRPTAELGPLWREACKADGVGAIRALDTLKASLLAQAIALKRLSDLIWMHGSPAKPVPPGEEQEGSNHV